MIVPAVMAFIGLVSLVYVIFIAHHVPRRTYYGLSDRRVLIIGGVFGREVESLPLHAMTNVTLRERDDRSGTIAFKDFSRGSGEDTYTPQLASIENARHVYDLIRAAQARLPERLEPLRVGDPTELKNGPRPEVDLVGRP